MAGMDSLKFALIGAYVYMAFLYLIWLLCDVAELWDQQCSSTPLFPEVVGKTAPRIISYGMSSFVPVLSASLILNLKICATVNFAAVAAVVFLITGLFAAQHIMKILFLIFNFIFIITMATMIGMLYSGKLGGDGWGEPGPAYKASVANHHENAVMMFSYMFLAVFLEIVVAIMP